jgi:hypothetical protein
MKNAIKIISIILLLLNGIGAFYGSYHLITDPTGSSLQLPKSYLDKSPFESYQIPGIILFIAIGLFSFLALFLLLFNHRNANQFIMLQGIILTGWILVQVLLIQIFYPPLHLTFLLIGLTLFICGYYLRKR